ncbi:MAG TPA: efflux RND transporter permease subunit [Candidatus Omnitrophota bacterium]|nr:efflux RND transporter permease subunit [Candidatus Omnitrophota bacterium]HPD85407.1 efflux RND transporter permease subunit [Candidatus Omnitrophota bacterium]HRZ04092.1 efflux RND transporter permease subunit [Candidatus Omnitrophota bacterium]
MKIAGAIAKTFIDSRLTLLLIIATLLLGVFAVIQLPREEEPQISVPFMDIFIEFPGATTKEVETRLVEPFERKLWEIPKVEYLYSTAQPNGAMIIARFEVGTDEEQSLVNLYTKIFANLDILPPGASQPLIKPRTIYDVPILALTFSSENKSAVELRHIAAEVRREISSIQNVSETTLIGGHRRTFQVFFDADKLNRHSLTPLALSNLVQRANKKNPAGLINQKESVLAVESSGFIQSADELKKLVVGISQGNPLYLGDVAEVIDGPDDNESDVTITFAGTDSKNAKPIPAVTLSISKRKATNAIQVVDQVLEKVKALKTTIIPNDVTVTTTRNYGKTAEEKSNELLFHMFLATLSVTLLIAFALGKREALVVFIAIPVTLALTLLIYFLFGYTLNRITLFALIFSIGILVDDAIVVVENIHRHHILYKDKSLIQNAIEAVDEVGNPTILATFAVIAAILPMAFVRGLMGPYMRPIPVGASMAMLFSLGVAFIVSPWVFYRLLKTFPPKDTGHKEGTGKLDQVYRTTMRNLLENKKARRNFFLMIALLITASLSLVVFKAVVVKMLPFDNKNEIQVIINMPEGTSYEKTRLVANETTKALLSVPEITDIETYSGAAAPFNFNGLVRHYYLRSRPWQADLQISLKDKHHRKRQSHAISKSIRPLAQSVVQKYGGRVQIAEVPPGPPVLATLVAEVYAPDLSQQTDLAAKVLNVFENAKGVTDTDTYVQKEYAKKSFIINNEKVTLNRIASSEITQTLAMALNGTTVDIAHIESEPEPVDIRLRLPENSRNNINTLRNLTLLNHYDHPIMVSELTTELDSAQERAIYHKNLKPVTYVTGDLTGRLESPVYAMLGMTKALKNISQNNQPLTIHWNHQPELLDKPAIKWDGEWQITFEVFRDLGIAFAAVLILIYVLVVGWFRSFTVPLVIMAPIPLTLVGILPGHLLFGAFFTATSMIGFIAGAGIVVRNSIILVDFIELRLKQGMPLEEAVIDAGATRFRPMLLTAAAVMVGSAVILFDPIFQGLAISLMTGEIASTFLSRTSVPVLYYILRRKRA